MGENSELPVITEGEEQGKYDPVNSQVEKTVLAKQGYYIPKYWQNTLIMPVALVQGK